jgi:hypothetical protein
MNDELVALLNRIRANSVQYGGNEQITKQGVILPILAKLGWDRDDVNQVVPEYSIGGGRVDYCLKIQEQPKIFLEAKRGIEDLAEHQEQLLEYAFREGVEIAILTNGLTWWLYLPTEKGSWEQRKFFTIDINDQDASLASKSFADFLAFDAVKAGSALSSARTIHQTQAKQKIIQAAIPRAWALLLDGPDELLLDLLTEKVESLCGFRPDPEPASQYLKSYLSTTRPFALQPAGRTALTRISASSIAVENDRHTFIPNAQVGRSQSATDFTGKRPRWYSFKGKKRDVRDFKEILLGVISTIYHDNPTEFPRVLQIEGRRKRPFSRAARELVDPSLIGDSGIYVETCRNANSTVGLTRKLVAYFNYPSTAFDLEVSE